VRHECLASIVLSIPEGIVEQRTSVQPIRSFMSIWHDCMGRYHRCVEGQMSQWFVVGARSHGVPPLRQVTQ
jgi:hypothetical protein